MKTYTVINPFRSKSLGKRYKKGETVRFGKERGDEYKAQKLIKPKETDDSGE